MKFMINYVIYVMKKLSTYLSLIIGELCKSYGGGSERGLNKWN